ncbi:hypothetical protein [Actinophytocola sp.]
MGTHRRWWLAVLGDGAPVALTFHFWSGASLTKSGTSMTGFSS